MTVNRFYLIILLALAPQLLHAQAGSIIGYVRDAETREPLVGAFVSSPEIEKGSYTNEEGLFVLEFENGKAVEVVVKYLGYKTEIFLGKPGIGKPIEILLTPDAIILEPTVITDNALRRIHPDPTLFIKDYAFLDDHYLMIVLDPDLRRNKLVLLDDGLKTVQEHFGLGEEPLSLYTDCMGGKHYLTRNWACQIDRVDGELILQKSSLADFERVMLPCRAQMDDIYYFEDRLSRFTTGYYYVEQTKAEKKAFYWTMDSVAMNTIQDESTIRDRMASLPDHPIAERNIYAAALNVGYLVSIQCPESYAPLFRVGSAVTVFDHNNSQIVQFGKHGLVTSQIEIFYDEERFWEGVILVDEEKQRAFTVYNQLGKMTVGEISLEDGSISRRWELPKMFVSRIQVKENEIYFLYKDNIYDPVNRLYAFDMEWE